VLLQKHFNDNVPDAAKRFPSRRRGRQYLVLHNAAGPWSPRAARGPRDSFVGSSADDVEARPARLRPRSRHRASWDRMVTAAHAARRLADPVWPVPQVDGEGLHLVTRWSAKRLGGGQAVRKGAASGAGRSAHPRASHRSDGSGQDLHRLPAVRGATSVTPSSYARPGATVSFPISWEDLESTRPDRFTVTNAPQILRRRRRDPWHGFESARRTLSKRMISTVV
jgi:hypothetical protein